PSVVAVVFARKLTALTPDGRVVRDVAMAPLVQLANAALDEEVDIDGADTADGRPITVLRLAVHGLGEPRVQRIFIHHYRVRRPLPAGWSARLRALRDAIGPLSPAAAAAWDVALTWAGPVALGAAWHGGAAVRLPHAVTAFEHDGPVYLRTGQPPGRTALYRFEPRAARMVELVGQGAEREIDRDADRTWWHLPCGGGAVAVHLLWQHVPWIVVRVDDPVGIFVQK